MRTALIGGVDRLPAGPRRAIDVDAQVGVVDLDVDFLGLGQHRDGRRRGVDPPAAFGRGDALDAVDPAFELQPREHAIAGDRGDGFLVAADVGLRGVDQLELPAIFLGEALVHAQQVAGEQSRLVAAGAGADFEHRGAFVGAVLGQQLQRQRALGERQRDLDLGQFLDRDGAQFLVGILGHRRRGCRVRRAAGGPRARRRRRARSGHIPWTGGRSPRSTDCPAAIASDNSCRFASIETIRSSEMRHAAVGSGPAMIGQARLRRAAAPTLLMTRRRRWPSATLSTRISSAPFLTARSNRLRGDPLAIDFDRQALRAQVRSPRPTRRPPRASSSTTIATSSRFGCRRVDQHRQPLDPRRPADRGGVRAAELFDQAVVAAAGEDGALRAELVGDEFERGVAVIIEPAHEVRGEFVGDPGGVEPGADLAEEILGLGASASSPARCRRTGGRADPCCRGCAAGSCRAAPGCPRASRRGARRNARPARAPRVAAGDVAERVELERHALDAELGQQLRAEREQFDVGLRLARADDLGVELVELAEAALLRALVAEGGAVGRDLERRELLPAFADR